MKALYKHSASLGRRLLAFVLDLIIMNLVLFSPFEGVLARYMASFSDAWKAASLPSAVYVIAVSMSVLAWLYFTLFEFWLNQTVGMMVLGLYSEGKLSFWRCLVRNVFILPFFPFFLLWLVEPLYLFFRGERWLERLTGTRTVEFAEYLP